MVGIGVDEGGGGYGDPWRAYLKRLSPFLSSHWGRCTLIRCDRTLYPCMQQWVDDCTVTGCILCSIPHIREDVF